jgi:hypothetical protein
LSTSALGAARERFRALAIAILPDVATLDPEGWRALESIVEDALAARPQRVIRQFRLFIRVAASLPILRYGREFGALSPTQRADHLARLENSRLLLIRRGFWGLRTLVYMGYYGQESARWAIGYRADSAGWSALEGGGAAGNAQGEGDGVGGNHG